MPFTFLKGIFIVHFIRHFCQFRQKGIANGTSSVYFAASINLQNRSHETRQQTSCIPGLLYCIYISIIVQRPTLL